jgi:hypothetical protein
LVYQIGGWGGDGSPGNKRHTVRGLGLFWVGSLGDRHEGPFRGIAAALRNRMGLGEIEPAPLLSCMTSNKIPTYLVFPRLPIEWAWEPHPFELYEMK